MFIDAPDETVIERIAGRADARNDDDVATVRRRLEQFHDSTALVIDHYARLGLLHRIDASRPVADVYADTRAVLVSVSRDHAAARSSIPERSDGPTSICELKSVLVYCPGMNIWPVSSATTMRDHVPDRVGHLVHDSCAHDLAHSSAAVNLEGLGEDA